MDQPTKFLRLPQVAERVGYSRPSIYRLVQAGQFPRPYKIGARASAWRESPTLRRGASRANRRR